MKFNKLLKQKRLEINLSDVEVAQNVGLNLNWYCDVETREDEYSTNLDLGVLRNICSMVGMNLYVAIENFCGRIELEKDANKYLGMRRNEIIVDRRKELGLTVRKVGDALGYEDIAVIEIEDSFNGLDKYNLDFLRDLSNVLKLPATLLAFS